MDEIAVFTLVRNTAMRVLQAANVAWKWRVEATQRWEKENEVSSMRITQDIRDYAKKGMDEMSRKFREGGHELYVAPDKAAD